MFKVDQFEIGPMQNFGYIISDDESKEAIIVDPAWEADSLLKRVSEAGLKLKALTVTHAHYDHTNAIEEILAKVDVPVYAQKEELAYSQSGVTKLSGYNLVCSLGKTFKQVSGGESILLGQTKITFLHTPGHTPGSQCILVGGKLITGDTLFIGGCGRTDLPGGNPNDLLKSLSKISQMPPHTEICPGHDYGSSKIGILENELTENEYLAQAAAEPIK